MGVVAPGEKKRELLSCLIQRFFYSVIGDPTSSNSVEHKWMHTDLQYDNLLYKNPYPYKLNANLPQTLLISSK